MNRQDAISLIVIQLHNQDLENLINQSESFRAFLQVVYLIYFISAGDVLIDHKAPCKFFRY